MGTQRISTAEMLSVTGFAPSLRAMSNQVSKADELCPAQWRGKSLLLLPQSWKVVPAFATQLMMMEDTPLPRHLHGCVSTRSQVVLQIQGGDATVVSWYLSHFRHVLLCRQGQSRKNRGKGARAESPNGNGAALKQEVLYARG